MCVSGTEIMIQKEREGYNLFTADIFNEMGIQW